MGWQDATVDTIKRFREVLALAPDMSSEHRRALYAEARLITMYLTPDAQRFWNMYLNVLRILFAAEADGPVSKEILYREGTSAKSDDDEDDRCPVKKQGKQCHFYKGHEGRHSVGG